MSNHKSNVFTVSIRTLLLVVGVFALCLGIWSRWYHRTLLFKEFEGLGATILGSSARPFGNSVPYGITIGGSGRERVAIQRIVALAKELDLSLNTVVLDNAPVNHADFVALVQCPGLRHLALFGTSASKEDIAKLAASGSIETLTIDLTVETRLQLGDLSQLGAVPEVTIIATRDQLVNVDALIGIRRLTIQCSELTDADLARLGDIVNLATLDVRGSPVTDDGTIIFAKKRPDVNLVQDF